MLDTLKAIVNRPGNPIYAAERERILHPHALGVLLTIIIGGRLKYGKDR